MYLGQEVTKTIGEPCIAAIETAHKQREHKSTATKASKPDFGLSSMLLETKTEKSHYYRQIPGLNHGPLVLRGPADTCRYSNRAS